MRNPSLVCLLVGLFAACGSDSGGTDPGSGTQTLLVQARVSWDREVNAAEMHVSVRRAGVEVTDATVTFHSNLGDVALVHDANNGEYAGVQTGWGTYYALSVQAGPDHLSGSISAPDMPELISPDPTVAIDAMAAPDGVVTIRWAGDAADSIRVRYQDFEYQGDDLGHVDIPATNFKESDKDLELRRSNSIALAGGLPDSSLSANCEDQTSLIVVNPF